MLPEALCPPRLRWRIVAAVLAVALGTTLSLRLFFRAQSFARANVQSDFSQRAAASTTGLQRSVQEHLEVLYNLGALHAVAARPLTREAFRELTQGPVQRYPGVQALGWVPRVLEAEREAYVAAARQDGLTDFQLTEWTPRGQVVRAARHDVYYPFFYIEPLERNVAALGFNLGSDPAYMATMQQALSTGEAVASTWLALAQDPGRQFGFLLFLPVYKSGAPHSTLEERRANLQGFATGLFHLKTLVELSLQGIALGNMDLKLSDITDATSRYLLSLQVRASSVSAWSFVPRHSVDVEAIRAGLHWETTLNVASRTWFVLCHPLRPGDAPQTWQAWSILVGGGLCTLICTGFILSWRRPWAVQSLE